jgi:hypothetical protein
MTSNVQPETPAENRDLRQLLEAVLQALDVPRPATIGDEEAYRAILENHAMHARIALRGVLEQGDDPGWAADYLKARLAEKPATGYRTWGTDPGAIEGQDDERERARRSVDARFPAITRFLANEHAERGEGQ